MHTAATAPAVEVDVEKLVDQIKALLPSLSEEELDAALNEVDELWDDIGERLKTIDEERALEALA